MCGRYTLTHPAELLSELGITTDETLAPRYNIAPTQGAPVARAADDGGRRADLLHWGLIPSWAKDPSIGNRMINARAETAAEKPSFRTALRRRRCLVLTDGFYEWKKEGKAKQPYFIHRPDRKGFVFAGLWEHWRRGDEGPIDSFTILTTAANEQVTPYHHRMPLILDPELHDAWLDPSLDDGDALGAMLARPTETELEFTAVSRLVNNPRNEVAECVEPL